MVVWLFTSSAAGLRSANAWGLRSVGAYAATCVIDIFSLLSPQAGERCITARPLGVATHRTAIAGRRNKVVLVDINRDVVPAIDRNRGRREELNLELHRARGQTHRDSQ